MATLLGDMFDSSGWIKYNKRVARMMGVEASIMLGELLSARTYWENRSRSSKKGFVGEFFHMRQYIKNNTSLTDHLQRKGEDILIEARFITRTKKGLPSKNHYTINDKVVYDFFFNAYDEEIGKTDVEPDVIYEDEDEIEEYYEPETITSIDLDDERKEFLEDWKEEYEIKKNKKYQIKRNEPKLLREIDDNTIRELHDNISKWWDWKNGPFQENTWIKSGDGSLNVMLLQHITELFLNEVSSERKANRMKEHSV